ncbi:MAG: hypothetical protein ABJD07_12995 [Gemmatimonadaceae bacterium]
MTCQLAGVLLAATMFGATRASAQIEQEPRVAVLGTVRTFFQGMRARDSSLMRLAVDSVATLSGPSMSRNGAVIVRSIPMARFISSVVNSKGDAWDERIYKPEIQLADYLATVWVEYDFYTGTTFHHCGVDAIQLAKTSSGWRIFQIADTEKTVNCPTR